ncbi:MAG: ABC transporter permease [Lawsonibacter sp.]|jgi:spermidine/putrescine transport system permease protein
MKSKLSWFAAPYVVWMALFTVIPILMMVVYAFSAKNQETGEIYFTLSNFAQMGTYAVVFLRSFQLALIATLVCLLVGYPVAYLLAKEGRRFQKVAMALIMLPMWMNFLLRTYAWMSILENTGLLNRLFAAVGIIDLGNAINGALNGLCAALNGAFGLSLNTARDTAMTYFPMINTQGAVVLGMVYNFLPFMILPIYSVIVKLDNSLLEAARDLGAGSARVFRKVIFPLSLPGVLSGITMVFVPAVSTFAISRLLGGDNLMLLGNLIEMQFVGTAYNPYLGSAISLVMMVIVVLCMVVMNRFGEGEEQAVML